MNNWWNESYFELPDKDHVHFHICTEYFCWLWKAIYLFNYKYFFIHTDVAAQFLLCFSLIQNTNRILSTKVPPGAITSINGMRVLSMWWVILGHCYAFQVMTGLPSKLFHIFITNKLPKIYFRRRNNSSRQQLFQYFKGEKGLSCNPGSEECQCRYERGIVISSHWVAWPLLLQL